MGPDVAQIPREATSSRRPTWIKPAGPIFVGTSSPPGQTAGNVNLTCVLVASQQSSFMGGCKIWRNSNVFFFNWADSWKADLYSIRSLKGALNEHWTQAQIYVFIIIVFRSALKKHSQGEKAEITQSQQTNRNKRWRQGVKSCGIINNCCCHSFFPCLHKDSVFWNSGGLSGSSDV